ncbi:MAG: efflux RND transporter periplasmic adaptor subunit [Candidatus Eremiobacteraeota bacterium]|nr:efflux RND transporter periplasmic adaptor subunit [Candidatus Eremiobacteraeota bacterium]
MPGTKSRLIIISICLIAFLCFASGCEKEKPKPTEEYKVSVQTIQPNFRYFQETLTFPGTTDAPLITKIAFMASGNIEQMYFDVGQPVSKGALMARLDQKQYVANLRTAQSQVGYAQANLDRTLVGSREEEKEIAKANMLQAEANLEHAQLEMNRYEKVYKEDALPKQQYDSVVNQHKVAVQQYKAAKDQYNMKKRGPIKEDIQISRSNVGVAQSNAETARVQLSYTLLRSPVNGIVSRKLVDIGALVSSQNPIYEIQSAKANDVIIYVPTKHIDEINIGDIAEVSFTNKPDKTVKAKVREIQPISDEASRSFRIKLRLLEYPDLKDFVGNIGKATFHLGKKHRGAFVPIACLVKKMDDKGFFIFIIDDKDIAHKVHIKVLKIQDESAMISGNISDKSRISLSGQEYLKDGDKCRIVKSLGAQKFVSPDKEPYPIKPDNEL